MFMTMDLYSTKMCFIRDNIEIQCVFTCTKFSVPSSPKIWIISFFPNINQGFVLNYYKKIGALSQFLQLRTIEITSTQLNWFNV